MLQKLYTTTLRATYTFFQTTERNQQILISTDLTKNFEQLNKLLQSCQMALKHPIKDKQLILMSDASFTVAGYATMNEDDPQQKLQSKRKTYAPIAFGSKIFNSTHFFQTKLISPALSNACDYVLQYNFVKAHVGGRCDEYSSLFFVTHRNQSNRKT